MYGIAKFERQAKFKDKREEGSKSGIGDHSHEIYVNHHP